MEREKMLRLIRQGHTGWWDRLFGKKMVMNVPNPDGSTRQVSVTESWRDLMIDHGVIRPEVVSVHVKDLDYEIYRLLPEQYRSRIPRGPRYTEQWHVRSKGISPSVLSTFYDKQTQAMYAVCHTEDPQKGPETSLVPKSFWDAL